MDEEKHRYLVKWREPDGVACEFSTASRHQALQIYVGVRKRLEDFGPASGAIVRIWHDGIEYFNEDAPERGSTRGMSCRQITGSVRPIPGERMMP
ncbi:MAG: hypothetical protein KGL39_59575 [Patescibacteria group bacterium]|nr:hypothetical protein [Patescibacteria group bacterium]